MFKGICSKTLLTYTGKKQHNSMYPIVHQDKVGWQGAIITVWWTPHWLPVIHPSKLPIYRNNQDQKSRNLGIKRLKLKNQQ